MSSFLKNEIDILHERVSSLENMISELVEELHTVQQNLQAILQAREISNANVICDVQSFRVGGNLITERTGWIIDKSEVICEGDEQFYLEKSLPFSIVSIKKLVNS